MKAVFILLALCISYVFAQSTTPFYITNPIQGSSFKAGNTLSLEWKNGVPGTSKVTLLTGTSAAAMAPVGVTFNINGSDGEYDWKVPTNLPQGATFSLMISYVDPATKAAANAFSSAFTITGTNGTVVTQSFVSFVPTTAFSSVVSKTAVSSAITTAITRVTPSASLSKVASSSVAASVTPTPSVSGGNAGFKASTIGICVVVMVASAILL